MGTLSQQWGAAWNAPQADAPASSGPQDGEYDVTVTRVVYSEITTRGELCPPTFIFFLANEFGEVWKHYQTLKSQKAVWYLKGWMRRLGLAIPANPDGILDSLKALEGCVVHIQVTHHEWQGRKKADIVLQRIVSRPQGVQISPVQAQEPQAAQYTPQPATAPQAQTSAQAAPYPQAHAWQAQAATQPWQPPQPAQWPTPQAQIDAAFPPPQPQPQAVQYAPQYPQAAQGVQISPVQAQAPQAAQYTPQPATAPQAQTSAQGASYSQAQTAAPQVVTQATQAPANVADVMGNDGWQYVDAPF